MKKIIAIAAVIILFLAAVVIIGSGARNTDYQAVNNQLNINMKITSPDFSDNGILNIDSTCDGKGVNPVLEIGEAPSQAKSLALVVSDPDAPRGTFYHWLLWNIDPATRRIEGNSVPAGATQGKSTSNENKYVGACPPSGSHRYIFMVYALDTKLDLPGSADFDKLEQAMAGHIIGQGQIMANYQRK